MVQQPQKIIRVKFEKTGKLQYISHLDLLRTMQTALRRAKVKMIYSEGFNPHMKITFALPLSIGTESVCEYMDIRTQPDVDPKYVMEELGKNLPDGMKIIDVYEASSKLTDIKYAAYTAMLDYGELSKKAAEVGNDLFSKELIVTKRTKKGERDIDIFPMIKKAVCRCEYGLAIVDMILSADSENYLNAFYLTDALNRELGVESAHRKVLRTQTYFADGKEFK